MKVEPDSNNGGKAKISEKTRKLMALVPSKKFVGTLVLYPFDVHNASTGLPMKNMMWVDVKKVKSDNLLIGKLEKIPWYIKRLKNGAIVTLEKSKIIYVTKTEKTRLIIQSLLLKGLESWKISLLLHTKIYPKQTEKFVSENVVSSSRKTSTKTSRKASRKTSRKTSRK